MSYQPRVSAPPDPPELPERAAERPRWPAWFAPAAFIVVVGTTTVLTGMVLAIAGKGADDSDAVATIIGTVIQSAVFIGTAVLFASFVDKPKPWQFGLRRTKFWPAVGWTALSVVAFYLFAALYSALAQPDVEQTVTEELGADQGTAGLIAAGLVVIVLAPLSEEFFFRGFFYRALRNRFPFLIAAAMVGGVFGIIHWDFSTAEGLLIVPPLAFLGFMFCFVYERTGSLFPAIAFHAINNSAAYAAQVDDGWAVSLAAGPLMIAALMLAPRALPREAPAPG